ncbi:MAG: pyridoxal-phosphate dependent enzyme [Thaumarchaeota archaeon]|nr:pyridoxal-phosphate dependent enzyme [Nitrososphaerota archaeon]
MGPRVAESILELVGGTPLVRLKKVTRGVRAKVYAKLEFFNPGGSVKDRIGLSMILDAERKGLIKPGATIVEPTSGNTGMGLALAAIHRGYKVVFTVPDKMSRDKIDLLRAVGARVRVTPSNVPPGHPESYVEVAKRITKRTPGAFMPNQYENAANPRAHYETTGPEIWEQTDGKLDVLVVGVGTGGTISGTAKFLKEKDPSIRVVGVDPEGSILAELFRGKKSRALAYKVEGIGEDFLPKTLDMKVIDDFVTVSDKEAMLMTRRLAREEGILAGSSSGAAVLGALRASRGLGSSKTVVVILPDTGRSYLNKVYNDDWMEEHAFLPSRGRKVSVRSLMKSSADGGPGFVSVPPSRKVSAVLRLMADRKLTHLLVVRGEVQVGCLSGLALIRAAVRPGPRGKVEECMGPPLPSVQLKAKMLIPGTLLGNAGAVAVLDGRKIVGVLTIADVINYLAET